MATAGDLLSFHAQQSLTVLPKHVLCMEASPQWQTCVSNDSRLASSWAGKDAFAMTQSCDLLSWHGTHDRWQDETAAAHRELSGTRKALGDISNNITHLVGHPFAPVSSVEV